MQAALAALADGKLTFSLTTPFPKDFETLRSDYNDAISQLHSAIQESRHRVAGMSAETRTISEVAGQLADRTQARAEALAETADTVSHLAETALQTAGAAEIMRGMAADVREKADTGAGLATDAIDTIADMEAGSKQIAEITGFIDDIAFQTNLLSLNAAVEAARAGSAGRGFAVVATEVRALASKTAAASRQIGEITEQASMAVARTSTMVRETGASMTDLVDLARQITTQIDEIAGRMVTQADWTGRIDGNLSDLDRQTRASTRTFEEIGSSIKLLAQNAATLEAEMNRFEVNPPAIACGPRRGPGADPGAFARRRGGRAAAGTGPGGSMDAWPSAARRGVRSSAPSGRPRSPAPPRRGRRRRRARRPPARPPARRRSASGPPPSRSARRS